MIEGKQTIDVRIPAMVRDGTILEVPISGVGIYNFHIRVHLRNRTLTNGFPHDHFQS